MSFRQIISLWKNDDESLNIKFMIWLFINRVQPTNNSSCVKKTFRSYFPHILQLVRADWSVPEEDIPFRELSLSLTIKQTQIDNSA